MSKCLELVVAIGLMSACGGAVDPSSRNQPANVLEGTGGDQPSLPIATGGAASVGSSSGGSAPWSPSGSPVSLAAKSNCSLTPQGVRYTATRQDFEQAIFGDWILCDAPSVFCTSDEVGLEITADGRWRKLVSDGVGFAIPTQGWGNEGTWEILDNEPGKFQLNLNIDGSGTVITIPSFAETPDEVRLNNNGVCVADYVRAY